MPTENRQIYQQARISRDPRFDGKFFICVKTTGIFCRTICPAKLPLEKNVIYLPTKEEAMAQGFRPCLRCKPECAPRYNDIAKSSYVINTVIDKITSGEWLFLSITDIADALNTSTRNLNKIFNRSKGISLKAFQTMHKALLAKQLIQSSNLNITDIACACGYSALSGFYKLTDRYLKITPKQLRKSRDYEVDNLININIAIRSSYDWDYFIAFQSKRLIHELEWFDGKTYHRNIILDGRYGYFKIYPLKNKFVITIKYPDLTQFARILNKIKAMFDLDANTDSIESHLCRQYPDLVFRRGLHIPGLFSAYEAGIRAICGQQVSVAAATNLLNQLVQRHGIRDKNQQLYFFPPEKLTVPDALTDIKTMQSKKNTLSNFSLWATHNSFDNIDQLIDIKGIGPWTINYIKFRALKDPDIWLGTDLGVKQALAKTGPLSPDLAQPWRSYLLIQLWSHL